MARARSNTPAAPTVTLDEMRERYYFYSGKVSDVARQLCFAGIAVVWLVSGNADASSHTSITLSRSLLVALALFLVSLALDGLQYAYGALIWGVLARQRERHDAASKNPVHEAVNWPTLVFFWSKLTVLVGAYVVLGSDVLAKIGKA